MQIIDNIIPKTAQDRLYEMLCGRDFRWYYRRNVTYKSPEDFPKKLDDMPTGGYSKTVFFEGEIDQDVDQFIACQQILDGIFPLMLDFLVVHLC